MIKPLDIFCEIPCLTERSSILNGLTLQKKWFKSADKRHLGQYLQKFVAYNAESFSFLNIEPFLVGTDQNVSIYFRTSEFIGSVPLRSPDNGKQIGDFVVSPRYGGKGRYEEYVEILSLLETDISPQFLSSLPLASGRVFQPPIYLEAVKFINLLNEIVRRPWRKFDRVEKFLSEPKGQINWKKYAERESQVENRVRFPTGINILSEFHREYAQIRFVFDLCKNELLSGNTPIKVKLSFRSKLKYLEQHLYGHFPLETKSIPIRFSDAPLIKNCKVQANNILKYRFVEGVAWKVDFAEVFEKFVQYIFKEVAKEVGGHLFNNPRFKGYSSKLNTWRLNYIEPDAVFQKRNFLIYIDAKYKSHLFNRSSASEELKAEHRRDLHQILAYTAFNSTSMKYGYLCYPAKEISVEEIKYISAINHTDVKVKLVGLPMKKDIIGDAKRILIRQIGQIERGII